MKKFLTSNPDFIEWYKLAAERIQMERDSITRGTQCRSQKCGKYYVYIDINTMKEVTHKEYERRYYCYLKQKK